MKNILLILRDIKNNPAHKDSTSYHRFVDELTLAVNKETVLNTKQEEFLRRRIFPLMNEPTEETSQILSIATWINSCY